MGNEQYTKTKSERETAIYMQEEADFNLSLLFCKPRKINFGDLER